MEACVCFSISWRQNGKSEGKKCQKEILFNMIKKKKKAAKQNMVGKSEEWETWSIPHST